MTDRPIIFSPAMVRALLAGRKTQTRRVFRLPAGQYERPDMGGWEATTNGGAGVFRVGRGGERVPVGETVGIWHRTTGKCLDAPYQAGDRLWIREAFALDDNGHEEWPVFKADGVGLPSLPPSRAPARWRSPIHMPRWASRLTLHVEAVRVERLQDISEADAAAEGLCCLSKDYGRVWKWGLPDSDDGLPGTGADGWTWQMWCIGHRPAFAKLWDSLHGQDAWAGNPHVVALTFRVERANIDAVAPAGAA